MLKDKIAVIGTGRLGTALTRVLFEFGFNITAVYNRTHEKAAKAVEKCEGIQVLADLSELPKDMVIIFVTVPDSNIKATAFEIAEKSELSKDVIVAHCSGALDSRELSPLLSVTSHLASFHPAQTFPGFVDDWKRFETIYFGIEGDDNSLEKLQAIVKTLNSQYVNIPAEKKILYHLGCVIASNFFAANMSAALQVMGKIGFDHHTAMDYLYPLVNATWENMKQKGPANAATGPVPRGDTVTVEKHIKAIEKELPDLKKYYLETARLLLNTVATLPDADKEKVKSMSDLLNKMDF